MNAAIIIAARGGLEAKRRCAEVLTPEGRAGLARAMLADMLGAIAGRAGMPPVWVVTPSADLADLARSAGAQVLFEATAAGLGAAFQLARTQLAQADPQALAVLLPGDLPLVDGEELAGAIAQWRPGEAGIVAAQADGGTGALLLGAGAVFDFAYGKGSHSRHVAAARAGGLEPRLIDAPCLSFDVDRPADIAALLASTGAGRTRAWIEAQLQPEATDQ